MLYVIHTTDRRGATYAQHCHAVDGLGKTEVCHLDHGRVITGQHHVLWLEVTMRNPLAVDVLRRACQRAARRAAVSATYLKRVAHLIREVLRQLLRCKGVSR